MGICLQEVWGNPASDNKLGKAAMQAVEAARSAFAGLIGANATEVAFTSGATESINLAIRGVLLARPPSRPHVITSQVEHAAVLRVMEDLQKRDQADVTYLATNRWGQIEPDALRVALLENHDGLPDPWE